VKSEKCEERRKKGRRWKVRAGSGEMGDRRWKIPNFPDGVGDPSLL